MNAFARVKGNQYKMERAKRFYLKPSRLKLSAPLSWSHLVPSPKQWK
jgi:hypothetical protein